MKKHNYENTPISTNPVYKSIEMIFPRFDMNVATFTFFFLTLVKKRPFAGKEA